MPNSTQLWQLLKIAEFRTPTHRDVRKKGINILKLPSVRNCFTLAMTSKLVVIINSLEVPTIKKILLYEMKFLVPNYSCLQNPWLGGLPPPDPRSLCPQLNLLNPTPNKIPGYATDSKKDYVFSCLLLEPLLILQNVVLITYRVPASCFPFYLVSLVSVVFLLLQTAVPTNFWKSWACFSLLHSVCLRLEDKSTCCTYQR